MKLIKPNLHQEPLATRYLHAKVIISYVVLFILAFMIITGTITPPSGISQQSYLILLICLYSLPLIGTIVPMAMAINEGSHYKELDRYWVLAYAYIMPRFTLSILLVSICLSGTLLKIVVMLTRSISQL